MAVYIIDPLADNHWLEFISADKRANIFHHPSWLRILSKQYGFRVFCVCIFNDDKITAGIPFCEVTGVTGKKKWVSLPFSDYSLPLYCGSDQLNELTGFIINEHENHNVQSIEICWEIQKGKNFFVDSSYVYHITELNDDPAELYKSFHRTKNQGIAKSLKQGLRARFSTENDAIQIFYDLHLKTRKKLGVPIQPKKFFDHIYDEIISKELGFIVIISKDDENNSGKEINLAAGLFMGFNETLTYKYNASDPAYLQYRPNNLIIWSAMQEGIKRGYKLFDFGKSDLSNTGLRSFKDGWAAVEKPLYYSYYPSFKSNEHSFNFLKDKIVAPLIKSSPDYVCKLIGEIAYKYFPSI